MDRDRTSILIIAPTAGVVTVGEIKTMLGVSSSSEDSLIGMMIDAAVGALDPASGGWLGRALCPQTWELRLSSFGREPIRLPYPVVTEVTSVKYDDFGGTEHTLTEDDEYVVLGLNSHEGVKLIPPYNSFWPIARPYPESVRIRYVSGYSSVPQPIKAAIALAVRDAKSAAGRDPSLSKEEIPGVRLRAWVLSPETGALLKDRMDNLISTYRVWN